MTRSNTDITVDAIVTIGYSEIVMIKRNKEPFLEKYVLPGGHFEDEDNDLKEACTRELKEEIGLEIHPDKLYLVNTLDKKDRDPRPGRKLSMVYRCILDSKDDLKNCEAGSDAKSIHVIKIKDLKEEEVGFDHWKAIKYL